MKNARMMSLVVVCFCAVGAVQADLYDFNGTMIDVEYWAGSGANEAITVVDFAAASPAGNSYAFGFRWDGAATSETMLNALDGDGVGGTLEVNSSTHPTYGFSVDGFSYDGSTIVSDGWFTTFPGFWWDGFDGYTDFGGNPIAGQAPNGTFADSQLGASSRTLSGGYLDGWSQEFVSGGFTPLNTPTVPVPEPTTLSLLGLGALALIRKQRRA